MMYRLLILFSLLLAGERIRSAELDLAKARDHWAYRLPARPNIPPVRDSNWARSEIDRFILSRIEARGLAPAPDASREVLLRRLHFDLTGLPPSAEEIGRFMEDNDPSALERRVDRLMASPHFGERWGRHWLDVARYAESVTLRGLVFGEAWRYRDYVVDSFNRDLPFDRFVREQIAGDLLELPGLGEKQSALIATAFLVLGNFNYEEQDKDQLRMDIVDEQLDAIGKGILGQTLGCARCHDHKFDPIPARDYYAMAGILRNTRSAEHANVSTWLELPLPLAPEEEQRVKAHETKLAELQRQIRKKADRIAEAGSGAGRAKDSPVQTEGDGMTPSPAEAAVMQRELESLRQELKRLGDAGPKRPMSMSVREETNIVDCAIHLRGSVHRMGEVAPRGFLSVAAYDAPPNFSAKESGRRELGDWLASKRNPLTARVFVNRAWHWLFGAGLVRSTDNFGTTGDRPSHPDLLDYLAVRFMEEGWSVKWLVRELVLSRSYQVSAQAAAALVAGDPENRLFARANRRRLDAEQMRDAMLAASGRLDLKAGGPTIKSGTSADYGYADESTRRSIYVPAFRNALPQIFELFDFADASVVTGQRSASVVAPQALYFLNHPFVLEQAGWTARRLLADDLSKRSQVLYRLILGRNPSSTEERLAGEHVEQAKRVGLSEADAWTELCQALFASSDFRYLD